MNGCHEPEKKTNELVTDFIDNCEQSFKTLESLIQLNQNGLDKFFEWAEKSETKLSGLINLFEVINKKQNGNAIRIEKFENEINSLRGQIEGLSDHIEKVHDLVNLEDRVTASDVLNRLTLLEQSEKNLDLIKENIFANNRQLKFVEEQDKQGFSWHKGQIEALLERIKALETHKMYQTDENRKVSKRMDDLEEKIVEMRVQFIGKLGNDTKYFKCPVCSGKGFCNPCSGRGEFFTGNSPGATAICQYCRGTPLCIPCNGKGIV